MTSFPSVDVMLKYISTKNLMFDAFTWEVFRSFQFRVTGWICIILQNFNSKSASEMWSVRMLTKLLHIFLLFDKIVCLCCSESKISVCLVS